MSRYFIQIRYNGSAYSGWQIQPNAPSVQECLQNALAVLLRQPVALTGCGRTDAGVHASCFYAHFDIAMLPDLPEQICFKLNGLLPPDIEPQRIFQVPDNAHARFDATIRAYRYHIIRTRNPFFYPCAWWISKPLDVAAMQEAASILIQHKDFASFCKSGGNQKTTLCNLSRSAFEWDGELLVYHVAANRFLRNMVRAMVGTLVEVGLGRLCLNTFQKIIEAKQRSLAGISAPAKGLFLSDVHYPSSILAFHGQQ